MWARLLDWVSTMIHSYVFAMLKVELMSWVVARVVQD